MDRRPANRWHAGPPARRPLSVERGQGHTGGSAAYRAAIASSLAQSLPLAHHTRRGTYRTPQRARDHGAARGAARLPSGASRAVGPGTNGRGGTEQEARRGLAWGRRPWSSFSPGHARQQRCAQPPNAGGELLPKAGARYERTLLAVSSTALLGGGTRLSGQRFACISSYFTDKRVPALRHGYEPTLAVMSSK